VIPGERPLRILVPLIHRLSFVMSDVDTLRSRHRVTLLECVSVPDILRCTLAVTRHDCVFCWFGSFRFMPMVLLARLLRKKVIVIAGGYDVANQPEIQYGNMRTPIGRLLGRLLFRTADVVSSYSQSGERELLENAGVALDRQRMIYLGFDPAAGRQVSPASKEAVVLTVARVNMSTIHRKGLLAVARVSRLMPEVRFVMAGRYDRDALEVLRREAGDNLRFTGFVDDAELGSLFAKGKVYFQPSLHEAFGCSVAEAMLYDCIPVVSNRYSLPEVVGESGYYVDPVDPPGMAATLRAALAAPLPGPESPRERIVRMFPASRRQQLLLALVDETCGRGGT
jgi:glycosyltransferase involved in cell wall biosynthesis